MWGINHSLEYDRYQTLWKTWTLDSILMVGSAIRKTICSHYVLKGIEGKLTSNCPLHFFTLIKVCHG